MAGYSLLQQKHTNGQITANQTYTLTLIGFERVTYSLFIDSLVGSVGSLQTFIFLGSSASGNAYLNGVKLGTSGIKENITMILPSDTITIRLTYLGFTSANITDAIFAVG